MRGEKRAIVTEEEAERAGGWIGNWKRKGNSGSSENPGSDDDIYQRCLDMQTEVAAIRALIHYEASLTKDDVMYTLDEPLASCGFQCMDIDILHVNFTAKKDNASGESVRFFAELQGYDGFFTVINFATTDPADEDDPKKILKSCDRCSKEFRILHPVGQYKYGLYDEDHYINYNPRNLVEEDKNGGFSRQPVPRPEPVAEVEKDLNAEMLESKEKAHSRDRRGKKEPIGESKMEWKRILPCFDRRPNRPRPTRPEPITVAELDKANWIKRGRAVGNDALKFIQKDSDYKFDRTVAMRYFLDGEDEHVIHSNFFVREARERSEYLYFAEVSVKRDGFGLNVRACYRIDGIETNGDTTPIEGCRCYTDFAEGSSDLPVVHPPIGHFIHGVVGGNGKAEAPSNSEPLDLYDRNSGSFENPESDDDIYQRCLAMQTKEAAIRALLFNNYSLTKDDGVLYKLDKPLASCGFQCMDSDIVHVNFTAKKDDDSGESVRIFAELQGYDGFLTAINFATTDPADEDDPKKILKYCDRCSEEFDILHPVGQYEYGLYDEDHYLDYNPLNLVEEDKNGGFSRPEPMAEGEKDLYAEMLEKVEKARSRDRWGIEESLGEPKMEWKRILPYFDRRPNRPRPTRPEPMTFDEVVEANWIKRGKAVGNDALKFMQKDSEYEYDRTVAMSSFVNGEDERVIHSNFIVREVRGSSEYLYFAEVTVKRDGFGLDVLSCSRIDDPGLETNGDPTPTEGCRCNNYSDEALLDEPVVHHPIGKFFHGVVGGNGKADAPSNSEPQEMAI